MSEPARRLLLPLVPAYRLALAIRELRLRAGMEPVRRLRWPVVSVGSLSAGGAGKTPLAIALAKLLSASGFHVDVLSRGFGRHSRDPARVLPQGTAEEFGDEPLLIAMEAGVPVYVADQRFEAGRMAEGAAGDDRKPAVHLLDDGFQHRQLARDVDILLVGAEDWRDHLLPAGNLREPRSAARRAGVVAIPADDSELESDLKTWGWQGPIWRISRRMEVPPIAGPVAAFCGIARPEQFFQGLDSAGLKLAIRTAFSDHHRYTARELERLVTAARAAGAVGLITTEKDEVRLRSLKNAILASLPLLTARLRVEIEDQAAAVDWLAGRLGRG
jgi:tetraacyldisaccharide 4'-kinase